MKSVNESISVDPSKRISNDLIDRIASAVLQRVSVVGGTATRIGTSLCINVSNSGARQFAGGEAFLARVAGGIYTDERYDVVEIQILGHTNGKWCVRDRPGGRSVVACNLAEMGAADVLDSDSGSGVTMSTDNDPCSAFVTSGSGSTELTGRTYDGFHGVLKTPSRIVFTPERLVEVKSYSTSKGDTVYYFSTNPAPIIPASYYFDETCLTDGCPDGEHWAGYLTGFAVFDDQAGDDMPECGA
jgi:hypothetical protein